MQDKVIKRIEEHGEKSGMLTALHHGRSSGRINDNIRFQHIKTGKELPYQQAIRGIDRNTLIRCIRTDRGRSWGSTDLCFPVTAKKPAAELQQAFSIMLIRI